MKTVHCLIVIQGDSENKTDDQARSTFNNLFKVRINLLILTDLIFFMSFGLVPVPNSYRGGCKRDFSSPDYGIGDDNEPELL